jgi:hypothetical protein
MKLIGLIFVFILVLTACSSRETCKDCEKKDFSDTLPAKADPLETALTRDTMQKPSVEQKENHARIEAKYGVQWDFCTCVTANDSINTAFEGNLTDKQAENLMARWEFIGNKCKEFLTNPNTTPEERAIHEKKVKKCLKANRK